MDYDDTIQKLMTLEKIPLIGTDNGWKNSFKMTSQDLRPNFIKKVTKACRAELTK